MKAIIVIPTLNEAENIRGLVQRVLAQGQHFEALVVDDNSPDGTAQVVRQCQQEDHRVHLLVRDSEPGLGKAVVAGFLRALELDADYIGQMDADGSHDPAMLGTMLEMIQQGDADGVIGSRYLTQSRIIGWGLHRHINSRVANTLTKLVTGLPLADATNGLRLFRRDVVERIDPAGTHSRGYSIILETNYRAHRMGCKLAETPITFHPRLTGESKMGLREIIRFCRFLIQLRLDERKLLLPLSVRST